MRIPKRGEKGFTLIELLIVVAILGVLAAVVIPNVGRFIGRGEQEAAETEFANIQASVHAMMTDNELSVLPNPVLLSINNMGAFPDATSAIGSQKVTAPNGVDYSSGDKVGFLLFGHDLNPDGDSTALVNYVVTANTTGTYTVDALGTVTQESTGY